MTVFPVGEDSLMLCSRCYAVVTQPWHDQLRETSDALAEAQRENAELRADAEIGKRWRSNSSLEEWFPFTHEELESLKELIEDKTALVTAWRNLVMSVNRHLEEEMAAHDKVQASLAEAQRERDAAKAENDELRADLVWAAHESMGVGANVDGMIVLFDQRPASEDFEPRMLEWEKSVPYDGTDTDLCRAIREARRGE